MLTLPNSVELLTAWCEILLIGIDRGVQLTACSTKAKVRSSVWTEGFVLVL